MTGRSRWARALGLAAFCNLGAGEVWCERPDEVRVRARVSGRDRVVDVGVDVINRRPPPKRTCWVTSSSVHVEGGVTTGTQVETCEK